MQRRALRQWSIITRLHERKKHAHTYHPPRGKIIRTFFCAFFNTRKKKVAFYIYYIELIMMIPTGAKQTCLSKWCVPSEERESMRLGTERKVLGRQNWCFTHTASTETEARRGCRLRVILNTKGIKKRFTHWAMCFENIKAFWPIEKFQRPKVAKIYWEQNSQQFLMAYEWTQWRSQGVFIVFFLSIK